MTSLRKETMPRFCPYCGGSNLHPLSSIVRDGWRYVCGMNTEIGEFTPKGGCGRMFLVRRLPQGRRRR